MKVKRILKRSVALLLSLMMIMTLFSFNMMNTFAATVDDLQSSGASTGAIHIVSTQIPNTSVSYTNLYVWEVTGSGTTQQAGAWPGSAIPTSASGSWSVDENGYMTYTFQYTSSYNLILNTGNNGSYKTADHTGYTGDIWVTPTANMKTSNDTQTYLLDISTTAPAPVVKDPGKIHIIGWDSAKTHIYVYDKDGTTLAGAWPGTKYADIKTTDSQGYPTLSFEYNTYYKIQINEGTSSYQEDIETECTGEIWLDRSTYPATIYTSNPNPSSISSKVSVTPANFIEGDEGVTGVTVEVSKIED
ncbi:MAG: hypothetical protein ACI4QE_02860, partial [Acutalibacteraceae bacterium]